jgi:hypothetical protein
LRRPAFAAGVSALYLVAFFLGGLWVGPLRVEYRVFGLIDGLAALLIVYVLLNTGALSWPRDGWALLTLVYATLATAQLAALLLPPPGVLEWIVLGVLLYAALSVSYAVHRTRVMLTLGLVALGLALLKYSALPFIWERVRLPSTPIVDLGALAEGLKGLAVEYVPGEPVTQLYALLAILAWVAAVWLQWPPEDDEDWLRRLSRADRDRLLLWLLREHEGRGRPIDEERARGYLDRGDPGR